VDRQREAPSARSGTPPPAMRKQILEAARVLITQRGFADVSLADIAEVVGVSKTAVAYHFHPKDRLLSEILEPPRLGLQRLLSMPLDRAAFVDHYVRFVIDHRDTFGLIFLDPSLVRHPLFGQRIVQGRHAIVERLSPDADRGSALTAWAALGAINIAVLQATDIEPDSLHAGVTALALRVLELDGPGVSRIPRESLETP
jgi:AcrR family transcriptional regulator